MSLREKINEQFSIALKNKDKVLVSTLRLVLAAIKDKDIALRTEKNKQGVNDSEIISLLKKMKKQRQESASFYQKGDRQELLQAETEEIKIIDSFLPKQLNEEEVNNICKDLIKSLNISGIKDMGKVMGELKKKYPDSIDFSKAGSIIKAMLQ